MAIFEIKVITRNSDISESNLKSMIVDALEQNGYSEESWQHEGEYFYGDFSVEVIEK